MLDILKEQSKVLGKAQWRPMLQHVAELHEGAIHPPYFSLPYRWEQVAAGEEGYPIVFGHWETVHMALDTVGIEPQHGLYQILNLLALQDDSGLLPGPVWIVEGGLKGEHGATFPPLWPVVLETYLSRSKHEEVLVPAFDALTRQIAWFEDHRRAGENGFYYLDCMDRFWESGIIEGVRFDPDNAEFDELEDAACVDATSHMYLLLDYAVRWAERLEYDSGWIRDAQDKIKTFIRQELYDDESGLFVDLWHRKSKKAGVRVFEAMWPMIVGAATHYQAERIINGHVLDPTGFYTNHPVPAVAPSEGAHLLSGWRGPSRNSLCYWTALGCLRYGRVDAARQVLERALDETAKHFEATGALWDCYDPNGGDPSALVGNVTDALGHNPLICMSALWEECSKTPGGLGSL